MAGYGAYEAAIRANALNKIRTAQQNAKADQMYRRAISRDIAKLALTDLRPTATRFGDAPQIPQRQPINGALVLEILNARGANPNRDARFNAAVAELERRQRVKVRNINTRLQNRLSAIITDHDRIETAARNARSRRQGLIGRHNMKRQLAIDALNASGFYNNANNFSGQGTYMRTNGTLTAGRGLYKRSKRRKTRLYSGRKPKRSKKRTLKQLLSSIVRRKRTR